MRSWLSSSKKLSSSLDRALQCSSLSSSSVSGDSLMDIMEAVKREMSKSLTRESAMFSKV